MTNHNHYKYRTTWSDEDGEYISLCAEFPSLSYLDENPQEALSGIMKLVKEVIEDMQNNGEVIPTPIANKQYSGKFMVRIPPHKHCLLVMNAIEQSVSLNRYIPSLLP